MADLSGLGDLVLTVGGDISPLEDALSGIPQVATAAAQEIQAAFDAIPSATTEVESSLASLSQGLTEAGNAASQAAPQLEQIPPALNDVETAAHGSEEGIKGMAEGLIALGEALVVTDAMKEFGSEALTLYGNTQKAEISLTALSGSAEVSETMISKLKDLAVSDALSFPTLTAAAQKMTALGFSSEETMSALQAAANAAAATGNDVGTVANSIDRMALSGTAAARQLMTLGISTQQLGAAMNVSADQVSAAFKALDQEDRITAIETALTKFGGVAQAQAQGISGQFQILKTQVEFTMEGIGAALAPVASQFTSFVTGLLPGIQALVTGFASLPAPIQEVIIVVAAGIPIVAGLAVAFGTFGTQMAAALAVAGPIALAMTALGAAIAAIKVSGVVGDLGTLWADIKEGISQSKGFFTDLGAVIASLSPSIAKVSQDIATYFPSWGEIISHATMPMNALDDAVKGVDEVLGLVVSHAPSAADAYTKMATSANNAAQGAKALIDADAKITQQLNDGTAARIAAAVAQEAITKAWSDETVALVDAEKNLAITQQMYTDNAASAQQYKTALEAVWAAEDKLSNEGPVLHANLFTVQQDYIGLQAAFRNAETYIDLVSKAYMNGQASITQYEDAVTKLKAAQDALNGSIAATPMDKVNQQLTTLHQNLDNAKAYLDAVTTAMKTNSDAALLLAGAQKGVADAEAALTGGSQTAATAVATSATTIASSAAKVIQVSSDMASSTVQSFTVTADSMGVVVGQTDRLATSTTAAAGATSNFVGPIQQVSQAIQILNGTVPTINDNFDATKVTVVGAGDAFSQTAADLLTYINTAQGATTTTNSLTTALDAAAAAATKLGSSSGGRGGKGGGGGSSFFADAASGGESLGSWLDAAMNAPIGGMSMSLQPGQQYSMPYENKELMPSSGGAGDIGVGGIGASATNETMTYWGNQVTMVTGKLSDASATLQTASTALNTAAATQQTAAQTAYDAAKAATIAANATTGAAQTLTTTNDSISASSLNAATLSSNALIGAAAILSQAGTSVSAAATTITSASTSLAVSAAALNTAVQAAVAPASSTFTPFAPVLGQLPGVGPNGGMTGGLNPAAFNPGYQSTVGGTGPSAAVNLTVNAPGFIRALMDEFVRGLQGQGLVIRRS